MTDQVPPRVEHHGFPALQSQLCQFLVDLFKFLRDSFALRRAPHDEPTFATLAHVAPRVKIVVALNF